MPWHTLIIAVSEFIEFRRDFKRKYRHEIAAGRVAGYTLFSHNTDAGDCVLFVPPSAAVLFERMPTWSKRLKPYKGTPDLRDFGPVPMGWGI